MYIYPSRLAVRLTRIALQEEGESVCTRCRCPSLHGLGGAAQAAMEGCNALDPMTEDA